jgi:chorismate mutase/prephenate dehydratase
MKELSEIRVDIDTIDRQIVELFERRMELTTQVAEYKISTGIAVFDQERELSKLSSVAQLAHNDFNSHGVRELFEHIMSVSRKRQYQLLTEHGKFAPTGFVEVKELDFSHAAAAYIDASAQAAKAFFPEDCGLQKCADWRDACEVLNRGEVNFAFLPMQDPASGYVSANYNLVGEYGFYILEEYRTSTETKDRYLLISKDKVTLSGADKISICFEAPDVCGSLYHLMSHLTYNNLNMNRIESIVISREPLDYRFFMDLSGNLNDSAIKNAIRGLGDEARNFKILGNYR